jgi:hypothetical protein
MGTSVFCCKVESGNEESTGGLESMGQMWAGLVSERVNLDTDSACRTVVLEQVS